MGANLVKREEEKESGMEALDRIERKLRKMRGGCEFLVGETNENHEQYLFQETYDLVINQIDFNINDID